LLKICVIPGDGIGSEVIKAAISVLEAATNHPQNPLPPLEFIEAPAGWQTFQETGTALPAATLAAAQAADAVLFGAVASPSHAVPGYRSPIVALRKALDLYANIRPVLGAKAAQTIDLVIVRENTEGLYAGIERLEDDGNKAIAERVITRRGSERIVRQAFKLAQERMLKRQGNPPAKVTIVHKANVLRVTDGLFREVALAVAQDYPEIKVDELLIDTAAMHMAQSPQRFEVVVTTNLFGDILSDVAAIHGGGLGLASSANLGDHHALFEPVHGAAPDITGKGIANPLATFGCLTMLLQWFASQKMPESDEAKLFLQWAKRIAHASATVLHNGPKTPDLGGQATTAEVTKAVIQALNVDSNLI